MDVFLSWSDERSKYISAAFKDWLPSVIQSIKPWMSDSDIEKGERWATDIAAKLAVCKIGLVFLTPENQNAPWILFEAGALSKTLQSTYVCTVLFELTDSDVRPPLSQFQSTKLGDDKDLLKLLKTINDALLEGKLPDNQLEKSFNIWLPSLKERLAQVPKLAGSNPPKRSDSDILAEILSLGRNQSARLEEMRGQSSGFGDWASFGSGAPPISEPFTEFLRTRWSQYPDSKEFIKILFLAGLADSVLETVRALSHAAGQPVSFGDVSLSLKKRFPFDDHDIIPAIDRLRKQGKLTFRDGVLSIPPVPGNDPSPLHPTRN